MKLEEQLVNSVYWAQLKEYLEFQYKAKTNKLIRAEDITEISKAQGVCLFIEQLLRLEDNYAK